MKTKLQAIDAEKNAVSGAWNVSAMRGELLIRKAYFGYSKREALAAFRREFA